MSLARKQALISGAAWLVVAVVFVSLVVTAGVDAFSTPKAQKSRSLAAAVILPGYLVNFYLIWRTRQGRRDGEIDERDDAIERRATEVTAIAMLLVVFLVSISLYDAHLEAGAVPVGWLWVMAYGTVAFVSLLHPVLRLILDYAGKIHG